MSSSRSRTKLFASDVVSMDVVPSRTWLFLMWVWMVALLACRAHPDPASSPPRARPMPVVKLASFDPIALSQSRRVRPALKPGPPPRLLRVGPKGTVSQRPRLYWDFDGPVRWLGTETEQAAEEIGFSIEPPLAGRLWWTSPTRLVFEPHDELPRSERWTVTSSGMLTTAQGDVDVTAAFSFQTTTPVVDLVIERESMYVSDEDGLPWTTRVWVSAGPGIRTRALKRHIHVTATSPDGETEPVAFRLISPSRKDSQEGRVGTIAPVKHWPAGASIRITVDDELPTTGSRSIDRGASASFQVARGLRLVDVDCLDGDSAEGCVAGAIRLRFSGPIHRSALKKIRPQHPIPDYEIGLDELSGDEEIGTDVWLRGDVAFGDEIVLKAPGLKDIHQQSLVEGFPVHVKFGEPLPTVTVRPARGILAPHRPLRIGVDGRHLGSVIVRVTKLGPAEFARLATAEKLMAEPWPEGETIERELPVDLKGPFAWSSTPIELKDWVPNYRGPILVEARPGRLTSKGAPRPQAHRALLQISGLTVHGWTSVPDSRVRIATTPQGQAAANAEAFRWVNDTSQSLGHANSEGLISMGSAVAWPEEWVLEVRHQGDRLLTLLRDRQRPDQERAESKFGLRPHERATVTTTTERALYRPGESIHLTGWTAIRSPYNDLTIRPTPPGSKVALELRRGSDLVVRREVRVQASGKFWGTLVIPEEARLGGYSVVASMLGTEDKRWVVVEMPRLPEFDVQASVVAKHRYHGQSASIVAHAAYYFGGLVPVVSSRLNVRCEYTDYRPPNVDMSWGLGHSPHERAWGEWWGMNLNHGKEEQAGRVQYDVTPTLSDVGFTYRCNGALALRDASAQEVGADVSFTVHPAYYLLAEEPKSGDVDHASRAISVKTVDFEGKPVPIERIDVVVTRKARVKERQGEGANASGVWREKKTVVKRCRLRTEATGEPAICDWGPLRPGEFEVLVHARPQGAPQAKVHAEYWVENHAPQDDHRTSEPEVSLHLSSASPKVDEIVTAKVSAPFPIGRGEVAVDAVGLRQVIPFQLQDGVATVPLQVTEAWGSSAQIVASLVQPGSLTSASRIHWKTTRVVADVGHRYLDVEVDAPALAAPRVALPVTVRVRDDGGRPVTAHVSLWAVDAAILDLRPLERPDFVRSFLSGYWGAIDRFDSHHRLQAFFRPREDAYRLPRDRTSEFLGGSGALYGTGYGGGGGRASGKVAGSASIARQWFEATPVYIADAVTDADGVAQMRGVLPDNLTEFRLTAIASAGLSDSVPVGRFGVGEATTQVSKPLIARPVLPRILRPGDIVDVGVLAQQREGEPGNVRVSMDVVEGAELVRVLTPSSQDARLQPGEPLMTRVKLAVDRAGTLKLRSRVVHLDGKGRDEVISTIPIVRDPVAMERVAVYGDLNTDEPAMLPLRLPSAAAVDPSYGGLSVSMSATLLSGLDDATQYLIEYPHGCLEQTSSRLLPLVALQHLSRRLQLSPTQLDEAVTAGLARLESMRVTGGGFGYWPGNNRVDDYASAYATWVLTQINSEDRTSRVQALLDHGLMRAEERLDHLDEPARDGASMIPLVMGAQALADAGRLHDSRVFDPLWDRVDELPAFAQAMLMMAMHRVDPRDIRIERVRAGLLAQIDERNDSARFEGSHVWWQYFDSTDRTSAIVLLALLRTDPDHSVIVPLARGLLQARRRGRWGNTQENAYALLALAEYAAVKEAQAPAFEASVWLDDDEVLSRAFTPKDRTTSTHRVAMTELVEHATGPAVSPSLLLQRRGRGRFYYRVGLDWAPRGPTRAASQGIEIHRQLRVRDERSTGPIPLGDVVAIDIDLKTSSTLNYAAITVPLPGGLEPVHLDLGAGRAAIKGQGSRAWWVSHQEQRPETVTIYADTLPPGDHHTTVFVRATSPGRFEWPSATAEMMYAPEVYGRTDPAVIEVH